MSKTREVACKFYICEGECSKGREGTFRRKCQVCDLYDPIKGGQPARRDLRKKKKEDINKKEMKEWR